MAVIKAENPIASQLGAFSMPDIEKQARAILTSARMRAERLLIEAQQEAEDLKRRAHAEALVEGQKAGLLKGLEEGRRIGTDQALHEHRQELASVIAALTLAAQEINQSRLLLEVEGKQAVVDLAIAIAGKVTRRLGTLDPQVLLANVDDALRLVVSSVDVRIAVHPSQKSMLAEVLPRISAKWPKFDHLDLIADGTLAPGGCRVFSGGGQIDGDLQLQLDRIAEELIPAPEEGS